MKLLIKIFSQTTCIILLVSSGIFLYTTYCWKNQSIQNINSYESSIFRTNILQFENKTSLSDNQKQNADNEMRPQIVTYAFRQVFHDSAVLYLDGKMIYNGTVYEFDVKKLRELCASNNHTVSLSDPLKELEEQLNQIKMSVLLSKQAAKQAEEKKNEIVMYLAHDIRTPLTTVIGYLSLLHEAPDMPEQQKEKYVKVALNKAERLEKLINELFEITKYNAHTVIIKKENVDLHCLIAQVIDEIYPTLSANGNTAVFTAEDNLSVNADPEKLARVFSNLLRNAASYSYPQTEITISAKRLEHDIQITFENRGKTIPQEQLNSIFEKFNRLDDARLSNTGGAGLGLSIAEEIIHLHGGKITASSQNETIDFVITLPLSA